MSANTPVILAVEDDAIVLKFNQRRLERKGYTVLTATSAAEARARFAENPDLLVLDIHLPDGSGYDLCAEYHKQNRRRRVPVIFLSGLKKAVDRVQALESGGDYYITKPYQFEELLACIERLLARERQVKAEQAALTVLVRGPLMLDIPKGRALLDGRDAGLTQKEFHILLTLMRHEGETLTGKRLYEEAWGSPANNDTRTIRTHIYNLRSKLGADNADAFDIVSRRDKGYVFLFRG
jgi:DNA-binding response OmpR family regulator